MEGKKFTVRAAERALGYSALFFQKRGMESDGDRPAFTGLNKSTVYRLLATLEGKGFLRRNPETEKYRLGFRIWELSANLSQSDDPAVLFLPEMERLRDELEETVSLYIRDGMERVRIQAVESPRPSAGWHPSATACPWRSAPPAKCWWLLPPPHPARDLLNDPSMAGERGSGSSIPNNWGDTETRICHQYGREGGGYLGRCGSRVRPIGRNCRSPCRFRTGGPPDGRADEGSGAPRAGSGGTNEKDAQLNRGVICPPEGEKQREIGPCLRRRSD